VDVAVEKVGRNTANEVDKIIQMHAKIIDIANDVTAEDD